VSEHEWSLLVIAAKGLRPAVAARITHRVSIDSHTEYVILVVDVLTGSSWQVRKRFAQFFALRKQLLRWMPSLKALPFPQRRPHGFRGGDSESALTVERQTVLEAFLRSLSVLARQPPELDVMRGKVLIELQQFIGISGRVDSLRAQHGEGPTVQTAQVWLHHCLNDPAGAEGRSCDRFIASFRPSLEPQALPKPNRQRRSNSASLSQAAQKAAAEAEAAEAADALLDSVDAALTRLADYFDGMQQYVLTKHGDRLTSLSDPSSAAVLSLPADDTGQALEEGDSAGGGSAAASDPEAAADAAYDEEALLEQQQAALSDLVRGEVELTLFLPLMAQLHDFLARCFQADDATLHYKLRTLRVQPQSFFEIPEHTISLSSWQVAIDELNTLDQVLLPSLKLKALVNAVHKVVRATGLADLAA
jgi:hypothetical protein